MGPADICETEKEDSVEAKEAKDIADEREEQISTNKE